jgi:hypothetical protein
MASHVDHALMRTFVCKDGILHFGVMDESIVHHPEEAVPSPVPAPKSNTPIPRISEGF